MIVVVVVVVMQYDGKPGLLITSIKSGHQIAAILKSFLRPSNDNLMLLSRLRKQQAPLCGGPRELSQR